MKRNLKNYFAKTLIICALAITASSCSKEETITEVPVTHKNDKAISAVKDFDPFTEPGISEFSFSTPEFNGTSIYIENGMESGDLKLMPYYSFSRPYKPQSSLLEEINMEVQLVLNTNGVEENIGNKISVTTDLFRGHALVNTTDLTMGPTKVHEPYVPISKLLKGQLYLKYRYWDYKTNAWVENKRTTQVISTMLFTRTHFDNPFAATNPQTGRAFYRTTRKPSYSIPPLKGVSTNGWFPSSTVPILSPGQSIYSANGQYRMVIQSYDGVLLLLRVSDGKVLWSNKQTGGAYLFFYPDGNLIMLNNSNQMVWSSDIYRREVATSYIQLRTYLVFQDDGNLVMEWNGGNYTDVVGATGTGGGESIHYGSMKL